MTSPAPIHRAVESDATLREDGRQVAPRKNGALVAESPSMLWHAPALLFFAIGLADTAQFADPDLWGHLAFGAAMLRQKAILAHDLYSYSVSGAPYLDHEWLAQVIMAFAYGALGIAGLKILKLACTAATLILLATAEAETGATLGIQFVVLITAALALIPQMLFRPQIFTFLCLAAFIAILARDNYRRSAPIWLAVPIMALWVNLHGGFIIGLAVIGVYGFVAGVQDLADGRGPWRGFRFGAVAIATFAATFATPSGFGAWRAVFGTFSRRAVLSVNQEWEPLITYVRAGWNIPHSGEFFPLLVTLVLGAFVISVVLSPRGGDLPLLAVAALLGITPFVSVRNLALAMIAAVVPLARHVDLVRGKLRGCRETDLTRPAVWRLNRVSSVIIVLLSVGLAAHAGLISKTLQDGDPYPAGAVAFMKQHELLGNILGDFDWGEYLIFHEAPESKVFIDGRYQTIYPERVVNEYFAFVSGGDDAVRVLERYPHDLVLIRPDSRAYALMMARKDWKIVYSDSVCVLFARVNSPAARIPGVPIAGKAQANFFP
jgi:hypothetical protein